LENKLKFYDKDFDIENIEKLSKFIIYENGVLKRRKKYSINDIYIPKFYLTEEDMNFVLRRFDFHETANVKIEKLGGTYVKDIYVSIKGVDFCFFIEVENGKSDDFSIMKCFGSKETNIKLSVRKALREAVLGDINAWIVIQWNGKEELTCALSGEILSKHDLKKWNVDHIYPFCDIVKDWLEIKNLKMEEIPLQEENNLFASWGRMMTPEFRKSFSDYHDEITGVRSGRTDKLRIIHLDAHAKLNVEYNKKLSEIQNKLEKIDIGDTN